MRISFIKILFILLFTMILAFLVNYLQPEGLSLFNENRYESGRVDESMNPPDEKNTNASLNSTDTVKQDYNKMAVEKNRVEINEDLLPSYNYKNDSDLVRDNNNTMPDAGSSNDDVNLSSLTKDILNQPRLISLTQAYELYRDKVLFVDARNQEQYKEGHIAGAINLPYFSLNEYSTQLAALDKDKPLVTYCEGDDCDMAIRLGNELFAKGFRKVFVFFGGWEEWENANYPVVSSNQDLLLN